MGAGGWIAIIVVAILVLGWLGDALKSPERREAEVREEKAAQKEREFERWLEGIDALRKRADRAQLKEMYERYRGKR